MGQCWTCGSESWHSLKAKFVGGRVVSWCSDCDKTLTTSTFSDVYFKRPYYDENFTDENDASTWEKGTFITSRAHKAQLMKKFHLREDGDRVRGARKFDPLAHRHAQESLRK